MTHPLDKCSDEELVMLVKNELSCLDLAHGLETVEFNVHTWRRMKPKVKRLEAILRMTKAEAVVKLLCALRFESPDIPSPRDYYRALQVKMNRLDTRGRKISYQKLHIDVHLNKLQHRVPDTHMDDVATTQLSSTTAETNAAHQTTSQPSSTVAETNAAHVHTASQSSTTSAETNEAEFQAAIQKQSIEMGELASSLVTEARKRTRVIGFLEQSQHETAALLKNCETFARANKQLKTQLSCETKRAARYR